MFSHIDKLISKHGKTCTYKKVTEGTYDINTSAVVNTETNYTVSMYQKNIKASQFNYPNLVGKNISLFYLAGKGLVFKPKTGDYVIYDSETFKVESVQSHTAMGLVEVYRIVAVK